MKLEEVSAANFDSACDGLRRWLSERLATINTGCEILSDQLESISTTTASLDELIEVSPV